MPDIHPQAVVSPQAELGRNVVIGPFCVIEPHVQIGDDCALASHVIVKSQTRLGPENCIADCVVLGGMPQHAKPPEHPGGLIIGRGNTIREYATLHRSLYQDQQTTVGDENLIMVGVHVGHDCRVGNRAVLTNNVMLAGHVELDDRAYLGGGVGVHQFCRVGRLAMVGGYAHVKKDVPPFVMIDDATSLIVGVNVIGLKRAGFASDDVAQIKQAYRLIYRSGLKWDEVVPALEAEFPAGPAAEFARFFSGGRRGYTPERRTPPAATVRLHRDPQAAPTIERKAG